MKYGKDNPLCPAYAILKKAGEFVIPYGKTRTGFWIGSDIFVERGHGTEGKKTVFVNWWSGKPKSSAQRIVALLLGAGLKAYTGSPYAL